MDLTFLMSILLPVAIGAGLVLYLASLYNRLYVLKNSAEATLGQIRVALKKRLDLIEQLVDAVKGYIQFERETFEKIANMRSEAFRTRAEDLRNVDRESRAILGNVIALAERYPDLKASTTVLKLMEAIKDVEDEIARQRYTFNNIVQEFNIMQDTIPSRYVAKAVGLNKTEYLKFEEEIERRPSADVWEQKP